MPVFFPNGRIIGKRGHRPRVGDEKQFPSPSLFREDMPREERTLSVFVDNIDNMARIEREIGKRIEAAKCSRWMNCQPRNDSKGKL